MAWEPSKPANSSALVSADIRQMWNAIERGWGLGNLLSDPYPLIWAAGDSAAPSHWGVTGTGVAIARTGTGLADTSRKIGQWGAKCTGGGSATGFLYQDIIAAADYDDYFDGLTFSAGAWVKSSGTNCLIAVDDGVGATNSSVHSGGGAWEYLTCTRTMDAASTRLRFYLECPANQAAVLSGAGVFFGEIPPSRFIAPHASYGTIQFLKRGNQATGTAVDRFTFDQPAYVYEVFLNVETAPTGAALIVDVNHYDGSVFQSMFSTRPQIAASASSGRAAPDGTFRYRCFDGIYADTGVTDRLLQMDIDQVGSTVTGADLRTAIRVLQFPNPLDLLKVA